MGVVLILAFLTGIFIGLRSTIKAEIEVRNRTLDELKDYLNKKDSRCPPHEWAYNVESTLQCIHCGYKAGQAPSDD